MLIGSTASWRLAERTPSIVQADRLARALGTSVAKMFGEVEQRSDSPLVKRNRLTNGFESQGVFSPIASLKRYLP
jgi:hypothetical protein